MEGWGWNGVSSGLAVALGAGLLVGLERERRKGQGDDRGAAGLRTFMVAALAGAVGYSLFIWLAVVVLFGVALMAALSYWRSRSSDPGLTTELALVAMTLIGMLAMTQPALAAACAVVLAAVLAARERLHRFATDWLSEDELHDGLLLAALALVLLPLLPTEPVIWLGGLSWHRVLLLVVMILLLQAGSHLGQRLLGPHLGLPVTGLLGGFVSSTATVGAVGAQVRAGQVPWRLALCAAVLSTAATWVQVGMMASVVAPALLTGWLPLLATGAAVPLVTGGGLWLLARRHARLESQLQVPSDGATSAPDQKRGRVLRPREALMVTVLLLGGAVLVQWARQAGQEGLVAGVAVAALADAHAPVVAVLSLQGSGELTWRLAVLSVLTAITVNSLTRMVVGVVAGGRRFGVMLGGAMLLNLLVVWGWWGVWG
jgi:uncharacterized membrane protein (DUF4010 family)